MPTRLRPQERCGAEPGWGRLAEAAAAAVPWLWPGRIPLGKLTILAGDPGVGKSLLAMELAARVTSGRGWPDGTGSQGSHPGEVRFTDGAPQPPGTPGDVILVGTEDDPTDTVRPRLEAAGGDPDRAFSLHSVRYGAGEFEPFFLGRDLTALAHVVAAVKRPRVVIIDPLASHVEESETDTPARVRALVGPLLAMANNYGVAIVAIVHLTKRGQARAIYRAAGSLSLLASARSALLVAACPDDPANTRRLLVPLKNNLAAPPPVLAFRIGGNRMEWESPPPDMTADELLCVPAALARQRRRERDEAAAWLIETLGDGPVPANDVFEQATACGFSNKTLRRAARDMKMSPLRKGLNGPWMWQLTPKNEVPAKSIENLEDGQRGGV